MRSGVRRILGYRYAEITTFLVKNLYKSNAVTDRLHQNQGPKRTPDFAAVSEEHLLGCSLRQRLKWLRAQQIKYDRKRVQAAQRGLRRDTRRQREWRDTEWIGGRPPPPPQPTIEQMLRGGLAKGAAVSADTLRARRRIGERTSESVATPWITDSSDEDEAAAAAAADADAVDAVSYTHLTLPTIYAV